MTFKDLRKLFYFIFLINFNFIFSADNKIINLSTIGKPNENLNIQDTEVIHQETFNELITQKSALRQPYIVARVETSDQGTPFVHYFDAQALNQYNFLNYPNTDRIYGKFYSNTLQRHILKNPLNSLEITDVQYLQINNASEPEFSYLFSLNDLLSDNHYFLNYLKNNFNNITQPAFDRNITQTEPILTPDEMVKQAYEQYYTQPERSRQTLISFFNQNDDRIIKAKAANYLYNLNPSEGLTYLNYLTTQTDDRELQTISLFNYGIIYQFGNYGHAKNLALALRYFQLASNGIGDYALIAQASIKNIFFNQELEKVQKIAKKINSEKHKRNQAKNKKPFNRRLRNLRKKLLELNLNIQDSNGRNLLMMHKRLILILCELPKNLAKQLANSEDINGNNVKNYLSNSNLAKNKPALFIRLISILKRCANITFTRQDIRKLRNNIGQRKFLLIINALKKRKVI